jgi:hypothetical protein
MRAWWGWSTIIDGSYRMADARFYGLTFRRTFVGVWRIDRASLGPFNEVRR